MKFTLLVFSIFWSLSSLADGVYTSNEDVQPEAPIYTYSLNLQLTCEIITCLGENEIEFLTQDYNAEYSSAKSFNHLRNSLNKCFKIELPKSIIQGDGMNYERKNGIKLFLESQFNCPEAGLFS